MEYKHRAAWGKCGETSPGTHHLAHHCADVAACFEAITALPTVQNRLAAAAMRPLSRANLARLTVIAFLHDAGKLHPGFQARGWRGDQPAIPPHGHVAEGITLLLRLAAREVWAPLVSGIPWWGDEIKPFLLGSLSHHGRPGGGCMPVQGGWNIIRFSATGSDDSTCYDPAQAARIMGQAIHAWFPDAFCDDADNLPVNPPLQNLFMGLVNLADWLGSDTRFFPFEAEIRDDYITTARRRAKQAVSHIRLDVEAVRHIAKGRKDFATLTGFVTPSPHQRALAELSTDQQLVILEAETGSGKTEAAVWRFAQLFAAGTVDGLYFALPTRSAAIQIHRRVNRMLQNLTGNDGLGAVLAVPGYLKIGDAVGEALPHWQVRWDDEGRLAEDQLSARWAAENARRFLAAPVAVGTVDQAMLAALQVRHAHLRGFCLSRLLLAIDEIHASDRYMNNIQTRLLQNHMATGGHALLMSATLGSRARSQWLGRKRAPDFQAAIAAPYPAIWASGRAEPLHPEGGSAHSQRKCIAMTLVSGWSADHAADLAITQARKGAKVLVIRNTVAMAVSTWEAIRASGGEGLLLQVAEGPALHHSRFAVEDRELLDHAVETALEPDRRYGHEGLIVVGSQTLEQSLHIDADHLITDLCPVDVLLQRLGRLHRGGGSTRPPGFEQPACSVLSPDGGLEPLLAPRFANGLGAFASRGGLQGVYMDLSVLELTRRLVKDQAEWVIPDQNRLLVESALHEDRIDALHASLGGDWQIYRARYLGQTDAQAQAASQVTLSTRIPVDEQCFPDDDTEIRTRLGAEGMRLTFPRPVRGPFGRNVTAVTLPAHWGCVAAPDDPVEVVEMEGGLTINAGGNYLRYTRSGIIRRNTTIRD